MPPVNLLIKPASGNCNMTCDYCFYCDEARNREKESYGFMSEKTLKNVIRKSILGAEGFCTLAFQGGEPTLVGLDFYKKVIEFVEQYNKNNIRINYALQTNGYIINEEWCEFFKENNFLVGLSIDGVKETHDIYRHGKETESTYEKVKKAAGLFDKYGVEYNILTVVNNITGKRIKEIYHDYKSRNWNYQQYITCLDPIMEERGKQKYSLKPLEYGEFLVELFDLWYSDLSKNQQPYIRQFENYVMIQMGYLAESCEQRGTCQIQNVVEADGSVYPCDFFALDEYLIGNFNENSIKEIYEKRNRIEFVEKSKQISNVCKACKYFSICKNGCQRSRIYYENENGYRNYFCEGYKMFFENCLSKINEIAKQIKSMRGY